MSHLLHTPDLCTLDVHVMFEQSCKRKDFLKFRDSDTMVPYSSPA